MIIMHSKSFSPKLLLKVFFMFIGVSRMFWYCFSIIAVTWWTSLVHLELFLKICRKLILHSHSFQLQTQAQEFREGTSDLLKMAFNSNVSLCACFSNVEVGLNKHQCAVWKQWGREPAIKRHKVMFPNCHCVGFYWSLCSIIYGPFCVHFILIRLNIGRLICLYVWQYRIYTERV